MSRAPRWRVHGGNPRKSKKKVGHLWGKATRPRIGEGLALDPPCLKKRMDQKELDSLFLGRAGGEGHKRRLPSRGLYSTHSPVSRTAQVSMRLRMRTSFPSAYSPFTRFSKQRRKGGHQARSLFFQEFMHFPLLHMAFFNRPTMLRAYGAFARRSLSVVPSSPLAIWAGCPSLLHSVRLWITGTNVVEWNSRRVTRSTVPRFEAQVVMITPGMLRSKIRSEIFDLPVPSHHGKERQKEERNYSFFSYPIPPVPEMHLLRSRERLLCQPRITALL
nr:hypothetical protein [Tanacetum cinerariifolium]